MTYRAHRPWKNHHKNGYNAEHLYHFKQQLLGVCHKVLEMCKIVHFHGFQLPKLRVHPAPEVHDFAIKCMNVI